MLSVEGVGSLGGEAGLVLATQDPVRQRELDLGVLQESERRS